MRYSTGFKPGLVWEIIALELLRHMGSISRAVTGTSEEMKQNQPEAQPREHGWPRKKLQSLMVTDCWMVRDRPSRLRNQRSLAAVGRAAGDRAGRAQEERVLRGGKA